MHPNLTHCRRRISALVNGRGGYVHHVLVARVVVAWAECQVAVDLPYQFLLPYDTNIHGASGAIATRTPLPPTTRCKCRRGESRFGDMDAEYALTYWHVKDKDLGQQEAACGRV